MADDFGPVRWLVWVIDPGELLDLAGAGLGPHALDVALLTDLGGRGDVDLNELGTIALDERARFGPDGPVG